VTEPAMKLIDETTEIESKALALPEKAKLICVTDNDSMAWADRAKQDLKAMVKEVDDVFKPMADKAFQAHRAITGKWKEIKAPLEEAEAYLVFQVKGYLRKVKEAEDAERRRLEEIARKEAEERALAEAEALAAEGRQEEADAVMEEEIYVPAPVVQHTAPKVDQRTYRTTWKAKVIDKVALIKFVAANPAMQHLFDVNQKAINDLARSQMKAMRIPGVQAYEE